MRFRVLSPLFLLLGGAFCFEVRDHSQHMEQEPADGIAGVHLLIQPLNMALSWLSSSSAVVSLFDYADDGDEAEEPGGCGRALWAASDGHGAPSIPIPSVSCSLTHSVDRIPPTLYKPKRPSHALVIAWALS